MVAWRNRPGRSRRCIKMRQSGRVMTPGHYGPSVETSCKDLVSMPRAPEEIG